MVKFDVNPEKFNNIDITLELNSENSRPRGREK